MILRLEIRLEQGFLSCLAIYVGGINLHLKWPLTDLVVEYS